MHVYAVEIYRFSNMLDSCNLNSTLNVFIYLFILDILGPTYSSCPECSQIQAAVFLIPCWITSS